MLLRRDTSVQVNRGELGELMLSAGEKVACWGDVIKSTSCDTNCQMRYKILIYSDLLYPVPDFNKIFVFQRH